MITFNIAQPLHQNLANNANLELTRWLCIMHFTCFIAFLMLRQIIPILFCFRNAHLQQWSYSCCIFFPCLRSMRILSRMDSARKAFPSSRNIPTSDFRATIWPRWHYSRPRWLSWPSCWHGWHNVRPWRTKSAPLRCLYIRCWEWSSRQLCNWCWNWPS